MCLLRTTIQPLYHVYFLSLNHIVLPIFYFLFLSTFQASLHPTFFFLYNFFVKSQGHLIYSSHSLDIADCTLRKDSLLDQTLDRLFGVLFLPVSLGSVIYPSQFSYSKSPGKSEL